jgi:hypothetical protein
MRLRRHGRHRPFTTNREGQKDMIALDVEPIRGNDPGSLRELARQCRTLARGASTTGVTASLNEIAADYEKLAARAETERF